MKTYTITEEQLKEIISTTLIIGNNFGVENPTTDEGIEELIKRVTESNIKTLNK